MLLSKATGLSGLPSPYKNSQRYWKERKKKGLHLNEKWASILSTFTMKYSYPSNKITKPTNESKEKKKKFQHSNTHTKKRSKILLVVKLLHTFSFFDTHYLLTQDCRLMYKHSAIYCKLHPHNEDQKIHMHTLISLPKCPKQAVIFWAYWQKLFTP